LVSDNTPHLGRCKEHILGTFLGKKLLYLILTTKVELGMRASDDMGIALAL
jgi:hypothetical protein